MDDVESFGNHPLMNHVVDTSYDDLPVEAVDATKQHILHTIGAALGGSDRPGCKMVVDLAEDWGGKAESSILVYGGKAPALNAALANGTMAHALDFCMNDDRTDYKSSVTAIPAALALAEGRRTSGKDFLAAVCLGIELGVRIALAVNPRPAHALSPVIGCFASAAAAGKILELDLDQMLDALGIAYCQVCPSGIGISSPSLTKRLTAGLAGKSGVFSARLAEKGFKGNRGLMRGNHGYFLAYHGEEGDMGRLTANIGREYEMVHIGPKGYPCCRGMHASIDAALDLVREYDVKPDDIETITVFESERNPLIKYAKGDPDLWERNCHPRGEVDAQFSLPWGVATALVRRKVFIEDFIGEALTNRRIRALAEKVRIEIDPQLSQVETMSTPSVVKIKTGSGRVLSKRVDFARGNPRNPVSMTETIENFERCATHAALPLSKSKVEEAMEMISHLEAVNDMSELPGLLTA